MSINKKSITKISCLGFVLSFVAFIMGIVVVVGYREQWWRQIQAFSIFGWATYIAIASIVLVIIGVYVNRKNEQKKVFILSVLSILFSLPILLGTFLFNYAAVIYPAINDISTDTKNPPSFWEIPNPMEYPEERFATKQHKAYPDLAPLILSQKPEIVFKKAVNIVKKNGWKLISQDEEEGQIEALASSLFFGFKDEVVIRIKKSDGKTVVDIRSRSRIGRIDRGANAKRIRNFIKKLKAKE